MCQQLEDTENIQLRDDLERELDKTVSRMESKGEQIAHLRKYQEKLTVTNKNYIKLIKVYFPDNHYNLCLIHYPAKLIYLNFQPLEVVSRYRDPQLQKGEITHFHPSARWPRRGIVVYLLLDQHGATD